MPLKQKIGISCWICILAITYFLKHPSVLLVLALGIPLVVMGIGPSLYKKINLPQQYWFIPLCTSMSFPIFFADFHTLINFSIDHSLLSIMLTVFSPIMLLISRIKECYQSIKISMIIESCSNHVLLKNVIQFVWLLVAEELLFRYIFFQYATNTSHAALYILINCLIFIYYHYFNRFSYRFYKLKDYIYHGLFAINVGVLFMYTNSFLLCVICHLLYNSIQFVTLILSSQSIRRVFIRGENNENTYTG